MAETLSISLSLSSLSLSLSLSLSSSSMRRVLGCTVSLAALSETREEEGSRDVFVVVVVVVVVVVCGQRSRYGLILASSVTQRVILRVCVCVWLRCIVTNRLSASSGGKE